jgi:2-oxoglutarate/2-oxoacid ferredoxin oxidoreductase subunit beta
MKYTSQDLTTSCPKTWCPGCPNIVIDATMKNALIELIDQGYQTKENFVLVSGIGCGAKISDYANFNTFYSLHGRAVPAAAGIKLGNPNLTVITHVGDGDVYSEGLEHLIFAAKRNSNIKIFIHDNRVFALTTGQFTPTSPSFFPGRSTPDGSAEEPFNPLELMLASGATFVARGYVGKPEQLKSIMKAAIQHKGFAMVEIMEPCLAYFKDYNWYNERVSELANHDSNNYEEALKKAREWDYKNDGKISLGIFYQKEKPTYEELIYN